MKDKSFVKKIIILLVEIIIGILIVYAYSQKHSTVEDKMENNNLKNESSKENLAEDENALEEIQENISIVVEEESSWNDGTSDYSTIQVTIKNESDKAIGNWKLVLQANKEVKFVQTWNGKWSIDENNLVVESVDYNSQIEAKSSINVGGTFSYSGDLKFLDYKLYSNGIEIEFNKEESILENNEPEEREIIDFSEMNIEESSPLEIHGKLKVDGQNIVDKNGEKFQIQGVSTHSIYAFPQYINQNVFKFTKEELNCNTIRLCVYTRPEEGYSTEIYNKVDEGIEYATKLGLYVILDWHTLTDNDPNINKESAKEFFSRMAETYKDYDNIIYEICNEPNGDVSWNTIKSYALEMIPVIREVDEDGIIIIGTPNYCKNLIEVASSPIEGVENLLYSFHFYAGSHRQALRESLENAYRKKLPIIVSEFGLSEYTGTGNIDEEEANKWIDYLRERNIGYICWTISNKDETSALLKSEITNIDELTENDLSQAGVWIKNKYNK